MRALQDVSKHPPPDFHQPARRLPAMRALQENHNVGPPASDDSGTETARHEGTASRTAAQIPPQGWRPGTETARHEGTASLRSRSAA